MTGPQVTDQQPVVGQLAPDRSFDPRNLARSLVEKYVAAPVTEGIEEIPVEGDEGEPTAGVTAAPSPKPTPPAAAEAKPVAGEGQPAAEEVVEEVVEPATPEEIAQVEQLLEEAGVDFGLKYVDVPDELKPFYLRGLQSAADVAQNALQERVDATELVEQVKEFAQRLKDEPDKLLLSVALQNPEAFAKAVETFSQMQSDERTKDLVIRELRAEALMREADRKERVSAQSSRQTKIQRVISATRKAAQVYGVPWNLAEGKVADVIKANGNDIEPGAVDGVLKAYAAELQKSGRKPVVRVATPQKVAAAAAAPNLPAGTVATAAVPKVEPSKGLAFATPHQRLRGIIGGALSKLREGTQ